ncbi:MAG: hypothetical protein WCF16_02215 [Alphaproteobacteria bacterium]
MIFNTLGWIAMCRAMTGGMAMYWDDSPVPDWSDAGNAAPAAPVFDGTVVPFPLKRRPRRGHKRRRSARSRRSGAEILLFRPLGSA